MQDRLGGTLQLGRHQIGRFGYGAMQLEHVDTADARQVLHRAVELGVNHLDTASFYGDATVNRHIRSALHPYADDLVIASKVGARHVEAPAPLISAQRPSELRAQVHIDLETLGVGQIPLVNLRRLDRAPGIIATGDQVVALEDQLAELVALREEGLIGEIGLSNVTADQLRQALPARIVCVQNGYNLLDRSAEDVLNLCEAQGVAWVPFFPLGSAFARVPSPAEHPVVREVAAECDVDPAAVSLAWILAHKPNTAVVPGTRSLRHLESNLEAVRLRLDRDAIARLDALA